MINDRYYSSVMTILRVFQVVEISLICLCNHCLLITDTLLILFRMTYAQIDLIPYAFVTRTIVIVNFVECAISISKHSKHSRMIDFPSETTQFQKVREFIFKPYGWWVYP